MTRRFTIFFNLFLGMTFICLGNSNAQVAQQTPSVQTFQANETFDLSRQTNRQVQFQKASGNTALESPTIPSILSGNATQAAAVDAPVKQEDIQTPVKPQVKPPSLEVAAPAVQAQPEIDTQSAPMSQQDIDLMRRKMTEANQPIQTQPVQTQPLRPEPKAPIQTNTPAPQVQQPTALEVPLAQGNKVRAPLNELKMGTASPQIRLTTTGPKSTSINKTSRYTINVANAGAAISGSLMVAVEIPQHIDLTDAKLSVGSPEVEKGETSSRLLWTIPNITPRSAENMIISLTPKKATPFDLDVEWTFVPLVATSKIQVTEPKLAMEISGPSEVKYGEKAIYTITLNNPGTGEAENVVVKLSETLGGEQATVGHLAPGKRKQFEVELIAREAGQIDLGATVKADYDISTDSVKPIIVRRAKLEVAVTAPKFKYAGSDIGYKVVIANQGDAIAGNVVAAIALPAGAKYMDGIQDAELTENGTAIRWNLGSMPAGEVREYSFQCLLNQPGDARIEVGARADGSLAAAAVGETRVDALADLTLTVRDPRGPQQLDQEVLYEIVVENRGTKEATNVNLVGQFSPGIEPTRTDGLNSKIVPGSVAFEAIPSIPVGKQVTVQVFAKADTTGTHTFRAELNCVDQDIRRVSEGTTKYFVTPEAYQNDAPRTSNQSANGGFSR